MASYNTVITNEGAALLASVIANQGTLTFSEMRFSTTDYDGVEQTLTVGTFGGVFITAAASGSVVDATTIKVGAQFDNSGIVGDHPLYSIGLVGTDGNTTALIEVCTTTAPDIIRSATTGVSTYAFNVNLAVSSTSDITVTGTTAAVLYNTDVVNTLTSTATDVPLAANMGKVLRDNLEHENLLDNPFFILNTRDAASYTGTVYGVDRWKGLSSVTTITPNSNGINVTRPSGDYWVLQQLIETPITEDTLTVSIKHENGISAFTFTNGFDNSSQYDEDVYVWLWSNGVSRAVYVGIIENSLQIRAVKLEIGPVSTIHLDVPRPYAIELARCQTSTADSTDTYANKGNLVNYSDITTIQATGTKNTTGTTITAGTYFYLNGSLCIAIGDIGTGATFTLNTNYKVTSVGEGWQVESVAECIPDTGCSFTGIASGDRLRVVRFKNGMKMLSGLITVDDPALIQNQYLATLPTGYEYKNSALQYNTWITFISYNGNPAIVGVINGSQHVVHWFPVPVASGYCVSPVLFY